MARAEFKQGDQLGEWTIVKRLGRGGNGTVYEVTGLRTSAALKVLHRLGSEARSRFLAEIDAVEKLREIEGVVRILDKAPDADPPWYVAELGIPFDVKLGKPARFDDALEAVISLAGTLCLVHEAGFAHRDIKPENLFWVGGQWKFGDFGLVRHETSAPLTEEGKKLGPVFYIAPEMLNIQPSEPDYRKADVFSLAKVLWRTAAGQEYPMPGHLHREYETTRLSTWVAGVAPTKLEAVLHAATHPNFRERPTAREFWTELTAAARAQVQTDAQRTELISPEISARLLDHSGWSKEQEHRREMEASDASRKRIEAWISDRFETTLKSILSIVNGHHMLFDYSPGPYPWDSSLMVGSEVTPERRNAYHVEHAIAGTLRDGPTGPVDFTIGIHVQVPARHGKRSGVEIGLDTLPAIVTAAYVYGSNPNGLNRTTTSPGRLQVYWREEARFILGGAEDGSACERLDAGLRDNLEPFFRLILQASA